MIKLEKIHISIHKQREDKEKQYGEQYARLLHK